MKIMVVDDEPDMELLIRQRYRRKIQEKEMDFTFARNGVEALQSLRQNGEIDIVLTDINMPEMDGLTLLANLNQHFPLIKSVIVSAYGDMANIRTALNRGAFDFITKPIDFGDLEITLKKAFQEASARRQAAKEHEHLMAIRRELEIAKKIQQSILPTWSPKRRDLEICAEMLTANEVGGDFYDFFLINEDKLGFVIGDVSGKGVPAAIFMAVTRTLLRATALKGLPPDECMREVNSILHRESVSQMFVTIFYGVLDTHTGEITYCNGGHHPPYILRKNHDVELTEPIGGSIVGMFENANYDAHKILLQPGDTIFLYTDGLSEAHNLNQDLLTEARLEECLRQMNGCAANEIIKTLVTEVRAFSTGVPQADDMTMLVLKYLGQ
jgi:sigma-B regulation protein RsbU (phosphoserine phosphatase)